MTRRSPYVGLNFFREEDTEFFFGRETERKRIVSNLRASRLTLLYAQSGVGKSSLLRAGVAASIRASAERNARERGSPRFVPVVVSEWHDDPTATAREALAAAIKPFSDSYELPEGGIEPALEHAAEVLNAKPLMILDQFEEFFLYHGTGEPGTQFADELAHCVLRSDLPANFLVSIREDAYSRLGDHFKARIPNVYANYLHLEHLDERSARAAIKRPVDQLSQGIDIEPGLIDDVLAEVRVADYGSGDHIRRYETALLQLVMQSIWKVDIGAGSTVLRRETFQQLGGGSRILEAHLDNAIDTLTPVQQAAAAEAFRFLVTPAGTKIAFSPEELSERVDTPQPELEGALTQLVHERIVRPVTSSGQATRYELFHDKLGEPVTEWRRRFAGAKRERAARTQRRRLIRRGSLIGCVLLLLLGFVALSGWRASEERRKAESRALVADAANELPTDPEVSLWLARLAMAEDKAAEPALRRAFSASRARGRVAIPGARFADMSAGGELVAVAMNGRLQLRRPGAGRPLVTRRIAWGIDYVIAAERGAAAIVTGPKGATVLHATPLAQPVALTGSLNNSVAISADGRFAAGVDPDGWLRIWDAVTGARVVSRRSAPWVGSVAFSPADSGTIVLDGCFGDSHVWRWRTGERHVLRASRDRDETSQPSSISGCWWSVSPDGKRAVSRDLSGTVRLWDFKGRRQLKEGLVSRRAETSYIAWSADSRRVAIATGKTARVFDARKGRLISEPVGHSDITNSVAFDVTGEEIITASRDATARVWNVRSGEPLADLRGHDDSILVAGFVASGRDALTVSADGSARQWRIREGRTLRGHSSWVVGASFDRTGRRVASASPDGKVLLWTLSSARPPIRIGKTEYPPLSFTSIAFDRGARRIVTTGKDVEGDPQLLIADAASGEVLAESSAWNQMENARVSPDGKQVVTTSPTGPVMIWDADDLENGVELKPPFDAPARAAEYDATGARILIAGTDGIARVLDARTRKQIATFDHGGELFDATFSHDGKLVLTVGSDATAKLWRVGGGRRPRELRGHASWIASGAFSPDDKYVVTGGNDGTTRVWDARTGTPLSVQTMHGGAPVNSVEFSPDGKQILSAGDDWNVRLYRCSTCVSTSALEELAGERTFLPKTEQERYLKRTP